ncbi:MULTISPECIES: TIGR01457 family HAD-type hydrolase [Listeria]|uniref:TIGR01457 family HAD-type hydrolase n=1 Tax=Listeria TaxID=1637 RepID=UPI000B58D18E|nr:MULTISPECIES: TIGR01457 family HAD-type hydrolase [Listeria]
MKPYDAYLIDLDGTMYRGGAVIPDAIPFVKTLNEKNIPHLFVTNNSTKTPEQVSERLNEMGIPATPEDVFTSAQATAAFMTQQTDERSVFFIGEKGLETALFDAGFEVQTENPAFVVVGMDTSLTYEKVATAVLAIRGGARFISTNADAAIPTERGLFPGNGSITAMVSVASETAPTIIGKPERIIMNQALARLGVTKDAAIMVGDNYETDILAGIHAEMDTLIVHTGFTSKEALAQKEIQPTYALSSLAEWQF